MPFFKNRRGKIQNSTRLENLAMKTGVHKSIYNTNGLRYRGNWRNDKKEEYGVMDSVKCTLHEGNFHEGLRHGFGVLSHKDILNYRGDWKFGKRWGFGYGHYYNGDFYKGYWENGKKSGYGQMWYHDASFYDGDWKNDVHHGLGMFVRPDCNRYEGAWANGIKHGKGRFFHLDNGQIQEGLWQNDLCVCSFMTDLPFRFAAVEPTPYPFEKNCLADHEQVYQGQVQKLLNPLRVNSCTIITSSIMEDEMED